MDTGTQIIQTISSWDEEHALLQDGIIHIRMLRVTLYCCRPSRGPAIAEKEPALSARQPSRGGSSKQRGSQTAREDSSRSLLGARREMYESKTDAEVSMLIAIQLTWHQIPFVKADASTVPTKELQSHASAPHAPWPLRTSLLRKEL